MLLALIGTIICCLDDSFVLMLILGSSLPELLIVLCISLIFFKEMFRKLFLIFKISLTLGDKTYTYDQLSLLLVFPTGFLSLFWKNFDFFRISLLGLGGIDGGI